MAVNSLSNNLVILPSPASRGQKPVFVNQGAESQEVYTAKLNARPFKSDSFANRLDQASQYSKDVFFSRAEKPTTNGSISQYVMTENILKRDEIQSLVGLDVYV